VDDKFTNGGVKSSFDYSLQNGSVELNLTEWFQATDNANNSATNDQQDTTLDLAASLLIGMQQSMHQKDLLYFALSMTFKQNIK
jgi:hypothetical protein